MKRVLAALFGAALALAWPAAAVEAPRNFVVLETPKALPDIHFEDDAARPHSLAEFHGKLVLLNLWATWCVPCRKEMHTLDRLQAKLGGPSFEVIAISIDRAGMAAVAKFYAEIGITRLAKYIDKSGNISGELGAFGIPATLLIDREGREIGRLVGPAEWDSPEIVEFVNSRITASSGPIGSSITLAGAAFPWNSTA